MADVTAVIPSYEFISNFTQVRPIPVLGDTVVTLRSFSIFNSKNHVIPLPHLSSFRMCSHFSTFTRGDPLYIPPSKSSSTPTIHPSYLLNNIHHRQRFPSAISSTQTVHTILRSFDHRSTLIINSESTDITIRQLFSLSSVLIPSIPNSSHRTTLPSLPSSIIHHPFDNHSHSHQCRFHQHRTQVITQHSHPFHHLDRSSLYPARTAEILRLEPSLTYKNTYQSTSEGTCSVPFHP